MIAAKRNSSSSSPVQSMRIPDDLQERIERVHGAAGRAWLAQLPALLAEHCQLWALELDPPFENLSYNLVIPGRISGGAEVVLKMGVPCRELLTEAAALKLFAGQGAVRLLADDAPRGILLLERVTPGIPLYKLQADAEATRIAADLMKRLWRAAPDAHTFPPLAVWFRAFQRLRQQFDGGTGPFPSDIITRAERVFAELNATTERQVILHGDLHHENILASEKDDWLAIDPKGICGDPGYEIGTFMLNQLPSEADTRMKMLAQRLSIFSTELQINRARLAGWAFCHAVLSALWNFEEADDWRNTIHTAQLIEQLARI
jgi:streptomycin 6-kinase